MTVAGGQDVLARRTSDVKPADSVLASAARTLCRDSRFHGRGISRERLDLYQPVCTHIYFTPSTAAVLKWFGTRSYALASPRSWARWST